MEDLNIKSIRFPVSVDEKFEKTALKLGRSKRRLFIQMVDYFYKSKKDPADLNDEALKTAMLKGQKEYIGFIKTQETELLIPIKREVGRMLESQKSILNCFNNQITGHNKILLQSHQLQTGKLTELEKIVNEIDRKTAIKGKLKLRFMYILNNYIKTRDTFNMMTSSKDKEELIQNTREQVNIL